MPSAYDNYLRYCELNDIKPTMTREDVEGKKEIKLLVRKRNTKGYEPTFEKYTEKENV